MNSKQSARNWLPLSELLASQRCSIDPQINNALDCILKLDDKALLLKILTYLSQKPWRSQASTDLEAPFLIAIFQSAGLCCAHYQRQK